MTGGSWERRSSAETYHVEATSQDTSYFRDYNNRETHNAAIKQLLYWLSLGVANDTSLHNNNNTTARNHLVYINHLINQLVQQ